MGSTLSSHQPRDAPANALPGGAVTDKVSAPTVLVDGDRVHERNLPESVVPFIDASDRATMRRLPMEAQYSAYREVRERQIIFAELHELQVQRSQQKKNRLFFFFFSLTSRLTARVVGLLLPQRCEPPR